MRIVILTGSPRKNGNSELLANAFADGARSKGHTVRIIAAADSQVNPCRGCNACFERPGNSCIQQDGMQTIYAELAQADMLVLATPVYFYGASAQLKTVIDRLHTPLRDTFPIRKTALLAVGAASLPELFDAILAEYRLCLNFFHLEDAGHVLVRSVKAPGDIRTRPELQDAFRLGASL